MKKLLIASVLCTSLLITSASAELAPLGSYVGGNPQLAPDGSYVGE